MIFNSAIAIIHETHGTWRSTWAFSRQCSKPFAKIVAIMRGHKSFIHTNEGLVKQKPLRIFGGR